MKCKPHHHHPGNPEEMMSKLVTSVSVDNTAKLGGLLGPASVENGHNAEEKPGV